MLVEVYSNKDQAYIDQSLGLFRGLDTTAYFGGLSKFPNFIQ